MKEMEILTKLNQKARKEDAPQIDVALDVMRRIRALQEPEEDAAGYRFLGWLTAFSSASAVLATAMIFLSMREWTDPLIALFFEVQ
ncbi:MAG: hypothetical protein JXK94_08885 [Deltaproteobacteria bacterium]|nr:hypothetical protein [Deltaproteobacteria bacterium]